MGEELVQFKAKGYTFDMGPSWYWMPDVFERFFNRFNKKASDYYELKKLDPGFQIIFDEPKHDVNSFRLAIHTRVVRRV